MTDLSRYYYRGTPIYLLILYDAETESTILYQKSALFNYTWSHSHITTHIRFLFGSKTKTGFSLYNKLTDYYWTPEIKVTSTSIGKLVLLVFYSFEMDFYFIAPYVFNLIQTIQHLCNSKLLTLKSVKAKLIDINTTFCDTIGLLNCHARICTTNMDRYLGNESIFNQIGFMKMKGANSELLHMIRYYWTEKGIKYAKGKRSKNEEIKRKTYAPNSKLNNEVRVIKISKAFENITRYAKVNVNIRRKKYLNKIKYSESELQYREVNEMNIAKFYSATNPSRNNMKETPVPENAFDEISLDKESIARINKNTEMYMKNRKKGYSFHKANDNNQLQMFNTTAGNVKREYRRSAFAGSCDNKESHSIQSGNVDLLGLESMIGSSDDKKSAVDVGRSQNNKEMNFDLDVNTIMQINQNVSIMENKMKYNGGNLNKGFYDDSYVMDNTAHFHSTPGNMHMINNKNQNRIPNANNYNSFSNNGGKLGLDLLNMNSNVDNVKHSIESYDSKQTYLHTMSNTNPYQNKVNNSFTADTTKFNTISNPPSHIPTYPSTSNINIQPQHSINNNHPASFNTISFSNNNYQPLSFNNNPNTNFNTTQPISNPIYPKSNIAPIYQQLPSSVPTGLRTFSPSQMFSQDDMSFLNGTTQTTKKEIPNEDMLTLSKVNPELYGELRERVMFTFNSNKQIKKMELKGYIGLGFMKGFNIKKKAFSLSILQNNWKDESQYQNKEFNQTFMHKVTETTYNIIIKNQSSSLKLLTYSNNQRALYNNNYIKFSYMITNPSSLTLQFKHNAHLLKSEHIYKTSFHLYLRSPSNIPIRERTSKSKITFQQNEIQLEFPNFVNECTLDLFNNNNNMISFNNIPIYKIGVKFEMKQSIISDNNIRITYKNSVEHQDELPIMKLALLVFEYEK